MNPNWQYYLLLNLRIAEDDTSNATEAVDSDLGDTRSDMNHKAKAKAVGIDKAYLDNHFARGQISVSILNLAMCGVRGSSGGVQLRKGMRDVDGCEYSRLRQMKCFSAEENSATLGMMSGDVSTRIALSLSKWRR
jgi:hypothetical protein